MSTTRHLINRQRRLAAVSTAAEERTRTPARTPGRAPRAATATAPARPRTRAPGRTAAGDEPGARARRTAGKAARKPRRLPVAVTLLALLTVALGAFAAVAAGRAGALRDTVAGHNTALTDTARTSEVKGQVAEAVNAVFSYNYADTARTDAAAKRLLTGKAVRQYAAMLAQVRAQAPAQKLVLTTTVTDTGVVTIDGDRARVLVFADQRNTSTAATAGAGSTYAAAMFAVDAVRQKGEWKIASIDTFG
jgi:Mce-associated membrane protein